jgi:hypothetical protein
MHTTFNIVDSLKLIITHVGMMATATQNRQIMLAVRQALIVQADEIGKRCAVRRSVTGVPSDEKQSVEVHSVVV